VLALDTAVTILCLSGALRVHILLFPVMGGLIMWIASEFVPGTPILLGSVFTWNFLLVLAIFALVGAWRNERFVRQEWRQRRMIAEQTSMLSLQSALARGMKAVAERLCDFVVSLGDDLRICVRDHAADSFFGKPMLGACLDASLAEVDVERLKNALHQASSTQIPQCLQITLMEGGHQGREAKLLVAGTGADHPKYIVGISAEPRHAEEMTDGILREGVRQDLLNKAVVASERDQASDLNTTFTGRVFRNLGLERVAKLGRDERWLLTGDDLEVPSPAVIIGKGSFGVVATAMFSGTPVAVKTMVRGVEDENLLHAMLNELRILRHQRHPNVVLLFGAVVEPGAKSVALVYELIRGMHLGGVLARKKITSGNRIGMLNDMISALRYLHGQSPPIVHSDLKDANVMVEELRAGFRTKLIDFGLSRFLSPGAKAPGGSMIWSPPEKILEEGGSSSTAADIFSFGWLIQLTLCGKEPFGTSDSSVLKKAVKQMLVERKSPVVDLPEGTPWREKAEILCNSCLEYEHIRRPTADLLQASLMEWLHSERNKLDFVSATSTFRRSDWYRGEASFRAACETHEARPFIEIVLVVADHYRVKSRTPTDGDGCSLAEVGDSFLDWCAEPQDFECIVASIMNDLRLGVRNGPVIQALSDLSLRCRRVGDGQEEQRTWASYCEIFVPAAQSPEIAMRIRNPSRTSL